MLFSIPVGIMLFQRRGSGGSLIKRVVYSFQRSKHVPSRREMSRNTKVRRGMRDTGGDTLIVSEEPPSEWRKCCIFTLALQAHTWTQEQRRAVPLLFFFLPLPRSIFSSDTSDFCLTKAIAPHFCPDALMQLFRQLRGFITSRDIMISRSHQ